MTPPATVPGLALRISVTDRCPLRCWYCRPAGVDAPVPIDKRLSPHDIVRFVRVARASLGVDKVRLTGGEPLARPDLVSIVEALGRLALPDLALTTNGQRLATLADALAAAGLVRINISLDSLVKGTFDRMSRGGVLADTLSGIEAALRAGLSPVRLNTVVLRGINDHEAEDIVAYALGRGCEARFIELMPSGLAPADYRRWFMPNSELRERLTRSFTLEPAPCSAGSSSQRWRVRGPRGDGHLGFISPNSHPFCAGCRRLRLTADGRLLGCLGRRDQLGILGLLRSADPSADDRLVAAMQVALGCKRGEGALRIGLAMSRVGG